MQQQEEQKKPQTNIDKSVCKKCRKAKPSIMLQSDPTCRDCFIIHVEHVFKMNLRSKCQITNKGQKLLILASCGQNSVSLLKLASDMVHNTAFFTKSKMFIEAEVLHIDESILWQTDHDQKQLRVYVEEELKLKLHVVKLHEFFSSPEQLLNLLKIANESGSAREDLVWFMKYHIILEFATNNNFENVHFYSNFYPKLVYASTGQRMASQILSSLAKGRGLRLAQNSKCRETVLYNGKQVNLLRPLKEILNKEIAYYLHVKKIDFNFSLTQHLSQGVNQRNKPCNGSIEHLLDNFVGKLQAGFPSTTFTILNTADKVKAKNAGIQLICPVCLSEHDLIVNILEVQTLDEHNKNQNEIEKLRSKFPFYKLICFACKRIFDGSSDVELMYSLELFPANVKRIAASQL